MAEFIDLEFGTVQVRRSALSKSLKISVAPNGQLRISMPRYAPLFLAKRFVATSRSSIRKLINASNLPMHFEDGMRIGKSHTIVVHAGTTLSIRRTGQIIEVHLPSNESLSSVHIQRAIREVVIKALQKEAKSYLPKRLAYLAKQHNYAYSKVRFSHASSRWGSCSSEGTISLNIALMKLDFSLVDYVLLHELAHTKEMNHSESFWKLVELTDPSFKSHRKLLKNETPMI